MNLRVDLVQKKSIWTVENNIKDKHFIQELFENTYSNISIDRTVVFYKIPDRKDSYIIYEQIVDKKTFDISIQNLIDNGYKIVPAIKIGKHLCWISNNPILDKWNFW